jgi:hypothetical protein
MWVRPVPRTQNAVAETSAVAPASQTGASSQAVSYVSAPWLVPMIRSAMQDRFAEGTLPCLSAGSAPAVLSAPRRARPISIALPRTNVKVAGTVRRGRAPNVLRTCRAPAVPVSCRIVRPTKIAPAAIASMEAVPALSGSATYFASNPSPASGEDLFCSGRAAQQAVARGSARCGR